MLISLNLALFSDSMTTLANRYTSDNQDDCDYHMTQPFLFCQSSVQDPPCSPHTWQSYMTLQAVVGRPVPCRCSQYESLNNEENLQAALDHHIAAAVSLLGL